MTLHDTVQGAQSAIQLHSVGLRAAGASAFGVSATEWTALAAAAQACAAGGAVALLIVTVASKRQAREAVRASDELARHTESLVAATRDAQALSVQPVIEVRADTTTKRLHVSNAGNGPLLQPTIGRSGAEIPVKGNSPDGVFVEIGALRPGAEAIFPLDAGLDEAPLILSGHTLAGIQMNWRIDGALSGRHTIVATLADEQHGRSDEG